MRDPFAGGDPPPEFHGVDASSRYIAMRDGVRVAIDVLLPRGLDPAHRVPALFKISRFGRARADGSISDDDRFWVEHGFARVLIDQRGTGASFGTSRYGAEEVPDLYDIVDWVVGQPWSNGRVGVIGVSFEGTAAELLAATNHPAVRAVAPWFSDYNLYTDLIRPGGMFDAWVMQNLQGFMRQMDAGASAKPVAGDPDGELVKQAVASHRDNIDIYAVTSAAQFADDHLGSRSESLTDIGIPAAAPSLHATRIPMLILASWYDAGTVQGTIARFAAASNPQTIFVGAWSHGADSNADPFAAPAKVRPSHRELLLAALQFFDRYLKGAASDPPPDRQFHYYTIGESAWHTTAVWPPPGLRSLTYHLAQTGELGERESPGTREVTLATASTGEHDRWRTQVGGGPVDYSAALPGMAALTAFTSAPLSAALEITGQAVLRLHIACDAQDPAILAYLIAVAPDGRARYLTEGHLRLVNRRLARDQLTLHTYRRGDAEPVAPGQPMDAEITLLPTSVLLAEGTRIQLLLASGDDATFATSPPYAARISSSSQLTLPIRR